MFDIPRNGKNFEKVIMAVIKIIPNRNCVDLKYTNEFKTFELKRSKRLEACRKEKHKISTKKQIYEEEILASEWM